jgi:hypothetical protein
MSSAMFLSPPPAVWLTPPAASSPPPAEAIAHEIEGQGFKELSEATGSVSIPYYPESDTRYFNCGGARKPSITSLEKIGVKDERVPFVESLEDRAICGLRCDGRQFLGDDPPECFDAGHLCRSGY